MKVNFKRLFNNYYIYLCIIINCLMVGLGYVLLVTLDNCVHVNAKLLIESVYSVYTQFGMLMLSPLFIYQIYIDYKEKNILFYKYHNYNAVTYFLSKVLSQLVVLLIGTFFSSLTTCIIANDFRFLFVQFAKCSMVMLFYLFIASFCAFIVNSYIFSFFINLAIWLIGIIVSSLTKGLRYLAYYDSSGKNFKGYILYINGKTKLYSNIFIKDLTFDLVVVVIIVVLIFALRKRWIKNGI